MKFSASIVLIVAVTYFSEMAIARKASKSNKKKGVDTPTENPPPALQTSPEPKTSTAPPAPLAPQTSPEPKTSTAPPAPQVPQLPLRSAPQPSPRPAPQPAAPATSPPNTAEASKIPPINSLPKAAAKKEEEASSITEEKPVETNSETDADMLELIEVNGEETLKNNVSDNGGFKGFTLTMSGMSIVLFLL